MIECHKKEIPHDLSQTQKIINILFKTVSLGSSPSTFAIISVSHTAIQGGIFINNMTNYTGKIKSA